MLIWTICGEEIFSDGTDGVNRSADPADPSAKSIPPSATDIFRYAPTNALALLRENGALFTARYRTDKKSGNETRKKTERK